MTAGGGGFPDRGGASGPSSIDPIVMGHTAGIVLGLLLGGANLFYLYRLAQNARVDVCGCGARGPKGERRPARSRMRASRAPPPAALTSYPSRSRRPRRLLRRVDKRRRRRRRVRGALHLSLRGSGCAE